MNDGWRAWLERGQKDLRIARMFEETDYEHAAYMAQQALEKHVKSVWVAGGMGQPKNLKHDIVRYLVSEIEESSEGFEFRSDTLSDKDVKEIRKHLKKVTGNMRKRSATEAEYWKHSLNIKSSQAPESLQEDADKAAKLLGKILNRRGCILGIRRRAASKAAGYGQKHGLEQVEIRAEALIEIIKHMELIVKASPHNTYGRYPTLVEPEKEISTALYARQSEYVGKMLNEVEEACTCLSGVAENLAKARRK